MELGQIINVEVQKLNSEGLGLAKFNDFVVFIKDACPDDVLKCKITDLKKNYAVAEIVEIVSPSKFRVTPKCKLQKVCGGCSLQHISYNEQLKFKKVMVEDTLYSILKEKIEVKFPITSGDNYNYRYKIQYPVRSKKGQTRILAGYFKPASHELVNIKYCPIQPTICDDIIEFIKTEAEKLSISGYEEQAHSGILRQILLRVSELNGDILVLLVLNTSYPLDDIYKTEIEALSSLLMAKFSQIKGVSINFNNSKTNVILGEQNQLISGQNYIIEKLCGKEFKISGETFFQVNPKCADLMFKYIKDYIQSNYSMPTLFDAYAGIAAFGIVLSDICSSVTSVELNKSSVLKAQETIKMYDIKNVEVVASDTLKYIDKCKKTFDITILDPPRKGCDEAFLSKVLKLTNKTIIYVSCNPKSLARDLKFLLNNGAKLISIQSFDMFPNTPHVENVAVISLQK